MPIDGTVFRNGGPNPMPIVVVETEVTPLVLEEGQKLLVRSAKYLYQNWLSFSDIEDKLAYDKLVWLIHNYIEPAVDVFTHEGVEEGDVDISNRSVDETF